MHRHPVSVCALSQQDAYLILVLVPHIHASLGMACSLIRGCLAPGLVQGIKSSENQRSQELVCVKAWRVRRVRRRDGGLYVARPCSEILGREAAVIQ